MAFGAADLNLSFALWHPQDRTAPFATEVTMSLPVMPHPLSQGEPPLYLAGKTQISHPLCLALLQISGIAAKQ